MELQTGINKKKPNTNRGRRVEEQIKPLSLPKLKSVKVLACLKGWTVVKLPMDLISADHTAEVRSSTAGSFNIYSVQSFGWTKVPITC